MQRTDPCDPCVSEGACHCPGESGICWYIIIFQNGIPAMWWAYACCWLRVFGVDKNQHGNVGSLVLAWRVRLVHVEYNLITSTALAVHVEMKNIGMKYVKGLGSTST